MVLSQVFLYIFIGTLIILFINLILGGLFDSTLGLDNDVFNLTTTLCFTGVASAIGFLLLRYTSLSTFMVITLAVLLSVGLTFLLNMFVFIPLSRMESSTAFKIEDMQGEIGDVTLRIPKDSIGEVTVKMALGIVSRTAKSYNNNEINQGEPALIIEVKDNTFYVVKYDKDFDYTDYNESERM
ncbi:hypothetical protein [Bacillus massiliigorillae]|uniref:hypothetical protein n=1 Tax=Bacillus massiliigorillae TaxID=1243664 RepID=UPI00039FDC5D|nr:hypothetical protein [Bacillus massiliigorillae]